MGTRWNASLPTNMSARVTERELFDRCYGAAHTATDLLERMADGLPAAVTDAPLQVPAEQLKQVRDTLREAYCAVQELKTRIKRKGAEAQRTQ